MHRQKFDIMLADHHTLFLTFFDYTTYPIQVSVQSVADSPIADILKVTGTEWTTILPRVSLGTETSRAHLHNGGIPDSQIHDTLQELTTMEKS
ncbi:hypothetical protein K438DRAFT_1991314 [Mycena galopus ATCC 62051]|nr:hypothetical protein K438DRAFT_1991314 [Mycena galopus ATCC 62051]